MNKNEIIELCLKELALEKAKAENIAYLNNKKAKQFDSFIKIDKEERNLVFALGKNKAFNIIDKDLEVKLQNVRKQKELELKKIGLSVSDLSPHYSCSKCGDTGYFQGKLCSCLKKLIHKQVLKQSGGEKDTLYCFDNFNENVASSEEHKTTLVKIKKVFQSIAEKFPEIKYKFVILSGKTGVGKTFLTECIASEIIDGGHIVSFVSAFGMNNLFTSYHTTYDSSKPTFLSTLLDPDLLIIDDLGTEPIFKNITKEYLYLILSERSRQNKLTIISTNLDPIELMSRYNERISSRLFNKRESLLLQINGSDIRLNKKNS